MSIDENDHRQLTEFKVLESIRDFLFTQNILCEIPQTYTRCLRDGSVGCNTANVCAKKDTRRNKKNTSLNKSFAVVVCKMTQTLHTLNSCV